MKAPRGGSLVFVWMDQEQEQVTDVVSKRKTEEQNGGEEPNRDRIERE